MTAVVALGGLGTYLLAGTESTTWREHRPGGGVACQRSSSGMTSLW
ncbi:hypothetical protein ACOT81_07200 [Streptomyces sp. WI04-05B]|nr:MULTISPECIES: hypothetical protein [unclassified Streptomyces]MDX2549072.1 hypothetical protein [Streptomyces sp. WI04-05B]MDX2590481.1 hypothetical protein [Streptomyces sp. WI04-05A]MDX3752907.1 hypothetical protein [Streptomyces sp. AK08-02]